MTRARLLAFGLIALSTAAVSAEPTPKDVWEYRHGLFESLATHYKRAGFLVQAGTTEHPADVLLTAEIMHATAKLVPHGFPAGTGPEKVKDSRALPVIWTDTAGFEAAAQRLIDETGKLVEVTKTGDVEAFKVQLKTVGGACGGCHETFRAPAK